MISILIIKKLRDIDNFNSLPKELMDHIRNFFLYIYYNLSDGEDINDFTLDNSGYIVVLQASDDTTDLSEIELPRGMTGSVPEYVDKITLNDNGQPLDVYHAIFLTNNEWCLNVFSVAGSLDEASEVFLRENSV